MFVHLTASLWVISGTPVSSAGVQSIYYEPTIESDPTANTPWYGNHHMGCE